MTPGLSVDEYLALREEQRRHDQEPERDPALAAQIRAYVDQLHLGDHHDIWNTLVHGYGTHCYECRGQGERRRYGGLDLCRTCVSRRLHTLARHFPKPEPQPEPVLTVA